MEIEPRAVHMLDITKLHPQSTLLFILRQFHQVASVDFELIV